MLMYEAGQPLDGIDYVAEADITASGVFTPEQVGREELKLMLYDFIVAAQNLDKAKKALFRKRDRLESGLGPPWPGDYTLAQIGGIQAQDNLFHGIIGVCTEAGELAEVLEKYLQNPNEEPDRTNVREEIGDVLWYVSRLVKWAGTTFLREMKRNIVKLRTRHGAGGFDKWRDINRDLESEREILEGPDGTA